jgi:hypothetical protein
MWRTTTSSQLSSADCTGIITYYSVWYKYQRRSSVENTIGSGLRISEDPAMRHCEIQVRASNYLIVRFASSWVVFHGDFRHIHLMPQKHVKLSVSDIAYAGKYHDLEMLWWPIATQ